MPSHVTPQTPGLTPTDYLLLDIRDLLTRIADVVAPAAPEPSGIETMNELLEDAAGELTDDVLVQVEEQLTESFTEALAEGNAEKAAEAATAAVQAGLIREQRKAKRR